MNDVRERSLAAALKMGRALGESRVITDPQLLERYGRDESEEPARMPDAAILPQDAVEAATALRIASSMGVPITPRAGGTGKSGGAVPVHGGLVMACERMSAIKEIDPVDLVAVVEPGVVLAHLHDAVQGLGLFYPPDPASLESCCIGGNVAENAGGPRAFKYGVTSHYVLGMQVATAAGATLRLGHRPVKGVAGYDLARLFVGSEGTLAFVTEVTLRLLPLPEQVATAMALFEDVTAAGRGIEATLRARIVPRVLEIMDRTCVDTVRSAGAAVPLDVGAMVLLELDGLEQAVEAELERAANVLGEAGATEILLATGAVQRERLWKARRDLSESLGRAAANKISDDISVPRSRLVETLGVIEDIAARSGLRAATFGHAGDGNLHVNFLWDDPDRDARQARDEVLRHALACGGTISGEHGIGSVKRWYLSLELGDDVMALSRAFKQVLDPAGILNPGKLF